MAHSVRYFMDDLFVASMFQTGIMYSALIQLAGDQAARLYSWLNGTILLLLGLALAETLGLSRRARLLVPALMLSSTALLDLMGDGKVDLASAAPALAAVYLLAASCRSYWPKERWLIGFLAGQAIVDRPFNAFILPALIGAFLWQLAPRSPAAGPAPWRPQSVMLHMAAGAIPWMLFHLAANWAVLGEPFAFVKDVIGAVPTRWQWAMPAGQVWLFRMLYPVVVSLYNTPQSLGTISPAVLAFLPMLFHPGSRSAFRGSRPLLALVFAAAITLAGWVLLTFVVFEIRYVLVLWIVLFLPLAVWIDASLSGDDAVLRSGTRAFLVILWIFLLLRLIFITVDTYSPVDPQGSAHCEGLTICDSLAPVNDQAPSGERVLTLTAYRYYLRADLFACSTTHAEYASLRSLTGGPMEEFWREVYREGYGYIAAESNYTLRHLYFGTEPGPQNVPAWMHLVPLLGGDGDQQVAYRIAILDAPAGARVSCRQDASGVLAAGVALGMAQARTANTHARPLE